MHEAKSQLSALAERVLKGERVIIAKAGKPHLELIPYQPKSASRKPGLLKGKVWMADDFDDTPGEIIEDFKGCSR
ncbi:MAG: type II toxin-antitoxin system prevent-host-death family antitoxin [Acidobacteria bacterium]|nr:MAG: type II toxin-antitoxin system prevent-host-death family antitoxin [Acidobacteriota bacterium]